MKKKFNPSEANQSLAAAVQEASTVAPQTLANFLHDAEQIVYAVEVRLQAAKATGDTAREKMLRAEAGYQKAQKRAAYFRQELAAFPEFEIPAPDRKEIEKVVVVSDYLDALRLKRDSEIASKAAHALDEPEERKRALESYQRAMRYLKYYEPRFKRFERDIEREETKAKENGHGNGSAPQ